MLNISLSPFLLGKDFVAFLFFELKILRWKHFPRRDEKEKRLLGKGFHPKCPGFSALLIIT